MSARPTPRPWSGCGAGSARRAAQMIAIAAAGDQQALEAAREVLGLAVAERMIVIGRARGDGHHRQREQRRREVDERLHRVRQQADRAGEPPGERSSSRWRRRPSRPRGEAASDLHVRPAQQASRARTCACRPAPRRCRRQLQAASLTTAPSTRTPPCRSCASPRWSTAPGRACFSNAPMPSGAPASATAAISSGMPPLARRLKSASARLGRGCAVEARDDFLGQHAPWRRAGCARRRPRPAAPRSRRRPRKLSSSK